MVWVEEELKNVRDLDAIDRVVSNYQRSFDGFVDVSNYESHLEGLRAPLCDMYKSNDCDGCPIRRRTGMKDCRGSGRCEVVSDADDKYTNWMGPGNLSVSIENHIEFLTSIRSGVLPMIPPKRNIKHGEYRVYSAFRDGFVYVGLTSKDWPSRMKEHQNGKDKIKRDFFRSHIGLAVTNETGLSAAEACSREIYLIEYYRNTLGNDKVLNKTDGGELGSRLNEALESASVKAFKCESLDEFKSEYYPEWSLIKRHGYFPMREHELGEILERRTEESRRRRSDELRQRLEKRKGELVG